MSEQRDPIDHRRLAALVDGRAEAIVAADRRAQIVYGNPATERLSGYTVDELCGQGLSRLVAPAQRPALDALLDRAMRGGRCPTTEVEILTKSGPGVQTALTVCPIAEANGTVTGVSAILVPVGDDVTGGDAEDADRTRRFLADAAHQLVTPITGIKACAETLMRGAAQDQHEQERLVARMVREAARAAGLLTALLRIAQLEDAQHGITAEPCDIVALCCDEADRIWTLAPELDMALGVNQLPEPFPRLDAGVIREILANLLDNARRHAASSVRVDIDTVDGRLHIRVSDDGPGLARADWERIFERFVSLDSHGGSGLGLAIGRALARAHGGELSYDDEGFLLQLPLGGQ